MMRFLQEAALEDALRRAYAEIDRLKRGDFTPEELQNLCHKMSEQDECAFGQGCEGKQRELFGRTYRELLALNSGADPIRVGPPYPGDE